jgi:hypothetical protein
MIAGPAQNQPNRNELHIINYPAGHLMSTDCFCEPSNIYWQTNNYGVSVLIIEHHDDVPAHHSVILAQRTEQKDWISNLLNNIKYHG